MTPVRLQDYVFLIVTALLAGILAASYALPQTRACSIEQGRATAGGLLSFLAIGCPTCNKIIVLLLGGAQHLRAVAAAAGAGLVRSSVARDLDPLAAGCAADSYQPPAISRWRVTGVKRFHPTV
jgi:hypothetical protein